MTTAREIMTPDATFCPDDTTAADAARKMADDGIGALPVCDADGRLAGVVTDRDLAVKIVAEGRDPETTSASASSSTAPRSSPSAPTTASRRPSAP